MSIPVRYIPDYMNHMAAIHAFRELSNDLNWERRTGAPRYEYWINTFDRPYTYGQGAGARTYQAKPSHLWVEKIRNEPMFLREAGSFLEGCFLNFYVDGNDSLGWHADDDPAIDHTRPIVVLTLGYGRDIEFKSKEPGSHPQKQFLEPGSLLIMEPGMQSTHFHRIPKVKDQQGPRISLTYRGLLS